MSKNIQFINLLIFVIILVIFESCAMTSITYYSRGNHIIYFIIGCILYGIAVPYLILQAIKYDSVGTMNFLWNIFSTIIMVVVSYYLFNDNINYMKFFGFIIGLFSIILIYYSE